MVCCVWLEGGLFTAPRMGWDFFLRNKLEHFIVHTVTQNDSPDDK